MDTAIPMKAKAATLGRVRASQTATGTAEAVATARGIPATPSTRISVSFVQHPESHALLGTK